MKKPNPMVILVGMELAELREARGWTRKEAVSRLRDKQGVGIGHDSLYRYEHARKAFPLDVLVGLCALYEVPVSVVMAAAARRGGLTDQCPICGRPS
jgi:transcriptional regulator with XRE-family HTH domain